MRMSGRRAFTLIELLTAVAIMVILAAILFPVFALSRDKARAATCLSNLKQIGAGVQMYLQDYNEELFPYPGTDPSESRTGMAVAASDQPRMQWWNALNPYLKNYSVFACPSDPTDISNSRTSAVLKSSVELNGTPFLRSYAASRAIEALPLSRIGDVASTIAVTEKWDHDASGTAVGDAWIEPFNGAYDDDAHSGTGVRMFHAGNRHQNLVNCVMLDGHAKALPAGTIQGSKDLTGCALIYRYPAPANCRPLSGTCTMGVKTVSAAAMEPNICDPIFSPAFHYP